MITPLLGASKLELKLLQDDLSNKKEFHTDFVEGWGKV